MRALSLYASLLGASFARLSPILRAIHDARTAKHYVGRCEVRGGYHQVARLIARIAGLPPTTADLPVNLSIERIGTAERWTRLFGARRMQSRLRGRATRLEEHVGPLVLSFDLAAEPDRILWTQHSARLAWVRLPMSWLVSCAAIESIEQGRYCFDASARLRGVGLLVRYRGWLVERGL